MTTYPHKPFANEPIGTMLARCDEVGGTVIVCLDGLVRPMLNAADGMALTVDGDPTATTLAHIIHDNAHDDGLDFLWEALRELKVGEQYENDMGANGGRTTFKRVA